MRRRILYISFITLALFYSCNEKVVDQSEFTPTIIVEGHIENGGYPIVFLTRNVPYYTKIDSSDIIYLLIRQAKVTVSNDEKSEILTLQFDKDKFPPFYYEGNELIGEPGKTYYLKIEYDSTTLNATTTIPTPVIPDSIWFQSDNPEKGKGSISVKLRDNPNETNYYKFFTKIEGKQKIYAPTLLSNFSDKSFNGEEITFHLNKGPESFLQVAYNDFYFSRGDTVLVKICTLDQKHFEIWQSYQNEITNGANPFASSFHKVESNIEGGGTGIWGGYGSNIYRVIVK